jgi:hypothetical protein
MPEVKIRKSLVGIEDIFHEGGPVAAVPHRRGFIAKVIENPFAGRYVEDIQPFMEDLKPLGMAMAGELIAAMGVPPEGIEGYGKGAIVGEGGETEHAALWHAPGGYSMREHVPDSLAIVPSTKKVGGPGARLDVPVTHVTASYVRSHFDAIEVGINDAPRKDEMVVVLVMTTGARVHNRAGGLAASDIKVRDGQK